MSATDRDENLNDDTPLPPGHPAEGSPVVSAGEVLSGEGMAQPEVSSGSSDVGGS
jgi:hypothetical protein